MSKKQIKRIKQIIILGALLGLIRSVIFFKKEVAGAGVSDLLQGLINVIDGNQPSSSIFGGDAMTENIYKKAIKGQKRKSANITSMGIDKMQFINTEFIIDKKDLLNILYSSNNNVYAGVSILCKECQITTKEIDDSYRKVFEQLKDTLEINNYNSLTKLKIDNRVNSQFIIASSNETSLQEFNEATLGEDLFVNGVADDSDYDLQVDMQNIGDLLFDSFIAPIETVFYKLPPNYSGGSSSNNNGGNNDNSNERQELINLLQNTLTPSGTINQGIITNGGSQPTQTDSTNPSNTNQTNKNQTINDTTIDDLALQNFVEKNSLSQKSTTQLPGIQGDVCSEGVAAGPIATPEEKAENIDSEVLESYLEEIKDQIDAYDNIYPEDQNIPNIKDDTAFDNMTPEQTNQFVQEYITNLFNVESTESCLKDCDSLPVSERLVCQIQCLCFTMVWPDDPDIRVKSMNEMLKLRFCMVPAASMAIPKGKNIYSLDDILTRIQSNMDNLINGGDMVKFQKTKEFLDNPIADFSFSKLISFQMNLNIKPIFNNKSAMAKKDQKETYIQKLEKASGKEQTLGTDTNKYLVVQDTAKNKVYKQYASSVEDYQKKYEEEIKIENNESRKNISTETVKVDNEITKNKSDMLTTIADFLAQNLKFREQTEKELNNLNNIVFSLQSKL